MMSSVPVHAVYVRQTCEKTCHHNGISRLLQRGSQEKIDNEYTFFEHSSF